MHTQHQSPSGGSKVFDKHTMPPVELDGSSVMCRDGIRALLRTKADRSSHKWVLIRDYPFLATAPIEGCEKLESNIKILRGALSRVIAGLQHANEGYSEDNFGDEIRAGLAAIEATKPESLTTYYQNSYGSCWSE